MKLALVLTLVCFTLTLAQENPPAKKDSALVLSATKIISRFQELQSQLNYANQQIDNAKQQQITWTTTRDEITGAMKELSNAANDPAYRFKPDSTKKGVKK
jgi:hypothetical protein